MPSFFSSQRIDLNKLPPLFYASLGALLGLLITAYVLMERSTQKKIELLDEFGDTVVQLAARELVDAAVNEDLVSMHAVLQSLVAQPRVVMATVHSLEQQLLVQAGQSGGRDGQQAYSAPITTHDTVQGYVSLTLASGFPGDAAVRWTLFATAFLLVLMLLLTIYESRGRAWSIASQADPELDEYEQWDDEPFAAQTAQREAWEDEPDVSLYDPPDDAEPAMTSEEPRPSSYDESVESSITSPDDQAESVAALNSEPEPQQDPADTSTAEPEPAQPSTPAQQPRADLILVLANFQRLDKQLNRDRFEQLVNDFEQSLSEVLNLYGGVQLGAPHNQNIYCVRFDSTESVSEAAFRAACSAYLIDQLNRQSTVRFNLVVEICDPEADVKLAVGQHGVFVQKSLVDDLLDKRLILTETDDSRLLLEGFQAPFAALLERQQTQLLAPV